MTAAAQLRKAEYRVPAAVWILGMLAWFGAIWSLSSRSSFGPLGSLFCFDGSDKVAHALAYSAIGALLFGLSLSARPAELGRAIGLAVAGALALGVVDELHQAFVPLRSPSGWDLLADAGGALLASALLAMAAERRRRTGSAAGPCTHVARSERIYAKDRLMEG